MPLGIKAVVCAIYEPPQESSKDTLRILPDPNDEIVEEAASKMGLRKVGWIFTDLVPSATTANKVCIQNMIDLVTSMLSPGETFPRNGHPLPLSSGN